MSSLKPGAPVKHYKTHAPHVEHPIAGAGRASQQGPFGVKSLTVENKGTFKNSIDGEGSKFLMTHPRSTAHKEARGGEVDTISIWVSDSGLGHIDLEGSDHVSLKIEPNLLDAFDNERFKTLLQGLKAPPHMVWGYRCPKSCSLWLVPLVVVSAITWLAPGANALATLILYKHVTPAASAGAHNKHHQALSRQLLAELAHLQELRKTFPMMPTFEATGRHRRVTVEQLAGNPTRIMECKPDHETLQNLKGQVKRQMPVEEDPYFVWWLEERRATASDFGMCDDTLHIAAMQLTMQDILLHNLALELKDKELKDKDKAAKDQALLRNIETLQKQLEDNIKGLAKFSDVVIIGSSGSSYVPKGEGEAAAAIQQAPDTAAAADNTGRS